MALAAQITANQANAQHSTGPRTAEGKARASQNSRKHGFTSGNLCFAEAEKQDFESLQAGLLEVTRPEGALETDPISDDPAALAKLDRCARYRRDLERSLYRALGELRKLQTQRAALLQQEDSVIEAVYSTAPLAEITRLTKRTDSFFQPQDLSSTNPPKQSFSSDRASAAARSEELREAAAI